ncbi:hypothetical protein STCU_11221 [Strigomonas culicis]|uniref:Uncharacterized protein n=1 Tax=Strigomonas culicis TaxID=28005 RepID=S9TEK1_9TRYP|nr:hypothetical protein STCU_11221 [Strigomonas culicis]|eukprot:EPY16477.1 hypothetical protein STCU_11221 [Strigomonas culicis]
MAIMHASGADSHPRGSRRPPPEERAHLLHTPNAYMLTTDKIITAVERGIRFLLTRQLSTGTGRRSASAASLTATTPSTTRGTRTRCRCGRSGRTSSGAGCTTKKQQVYRRRGMLPMEVGDQKERNANNNKKR